MSGHRPFNELTKDFAPERRRRIASMKAKLLADAPLNELRRAKAPAQQELAEALEVKQSAGGRGEMTEYERLYLIEETVKPADSVEPGSDEMGT